MTIRSVEEQLATKLEKVVRITGARRQDRSLTEASTTLPGIDGPTDQSRRTSTR